MNHTFLPSTRFSPNRKYRYLLSRDLGFAGDGAIMFVMLNPSTADEHQDDPTIRRCISFGKRWGFSTLFVTNLSPLRATDPKRLIQAGPEPDYVWDENIDNIVETALNCRMVVAAWGTHGHAENRAARVLEVLSPLATIHCLGTTKAAEPLHPLYIPSTTRPQLYRHGGKALDSDAHLQHGMTATTSSGSRREDAKDILRQKADRRCACGGGDQGAS